MITFSVSDTRRRLGELIDLAHKGEEIVIIKDSKPVAMLSAIGPEDLELTTRIDDRQAAKIHRWLDREPMVTFPDASTAVRFLVKDSPRKGTRKRR